ncbi:hypothetical protein M413DRAFT_448731 [Hebeloma cylindrosporum]|uniref:Uncharacterized protein n=1 Tax=Hebeloma cylindrosporum TaxID=76867 RepID=A0A0C2XGF6_HEBCY|nr:hypothetical protein M413DRAFT_448731 [Hebeloma cylindrosporum h7]
MSMFFPSDSHDHAFVTRPFDNVHAALPISGTDDRGTHSEGLIRSQSVSAIYPGPSSRDVRHFPDLPVIPPRSRSISLSLSASSPRFNHHLSSDFDDFGPADDFASQSFTSSSLSDLVDTLRPRFSSERRNVTMASAGNLDGGRNDSEVSSLNSHGYAAEEESMSMWNRQTSSQLRHTWTRNR